MTCNHPSGDYCVNCVDLNNPPYVNKFSPHCAFKHRILRELARRFNLKVFVETGTCRGETVNFLKDEFLEIRTIELHPDLYNYAVTRFQDKKWIHCIHGNSGVMLEKVLDDIDRPALIWIDAHVAGPDTADEGWPLQDELQTIYKKSPQSLIVVDDCYPTDLDNMNEPEGWVKRWYHGLIFLHRGQYQIPERF